MKPQRAAEIIAKAKESATIRSMVRSNQQIHDTRRTPCFGDGLENNARPHMFCGCSGEDCKGGTVKKSRKPSPKQLTVVMERESLNEAVYVNGQYHSCDTTIYAGALAEIADGQPVYLEHMTVESRPHDSQWPATLSELTELKEE